MDAPHLDKNGMEILSREDAIRLLSGKTVGRLSVTMRALPTILPVNYVVDGEHIVFRTGNGTKLDAATRNAVVAFEVDELDETRRSGWSVVVIGTARAVEDPAEIRRLESLPIDPWVASARLDNFVQVPIVHVAGRRIVSVHASASAGAGVSESELA